MTLSMMTASVPSVVASSQVLSPALVRSSIANICLMLAGIVAMSDASAATSVCNMAELNKAANPAAAGAEIVMCNGTWNDAAILIKGNGTSSAPIRLRAEIGGKVVLTGASSVAMSGSHIEVDGLWFRGQNDNSSSPVVEFSVGGQDCNNCRLTNTAITDYNLADSSVYRDWVNVTGQRNRIDHNYFSGKNYRGPVVEVHRKSAAADYHRIDHNFFSRPDFAFGNNGESVKIGQFFPESNSETVVEDNYFYRADGEIETISIKSSGNTIRRNTLEETQGSITLRDGNANRIEGNFILGRNRPGTGGIRVTGEDHVIVNNYISELDGEGSETRGGIVLVSGDAVIAENGSYKPVRNVVVVHNTIVASKMSLVFGANSRPVAPAQVTLANNIVVGDSGPLIKEVMPLSQAKYERNLFYGGSALGISQPAGIELVDPKLVAGAAGLMRPGTNSPAINRAAGGYGVTSDIDGQNRTGTFDIGADEVMSGAATVVPQNRCSVGPLSFDASGLCDRVAPPDAPTSVTAD